ncbi:glycosyltransferase family 2 protein [Flavobacterium sp. TAB 87]|uniref:glycosyltransferase family 2 protein n=1 Tax=Flavobacterium sp. TAB 87 TaxID=1729581 RepID=UPI00076BD8B9|nr:glycosyltransferase family A protein [Flavobacterium sp. TAB 87]KVV15873.1 Chondroitin polymerase [Flavobacterium sp. TAB 87]
MINRVSNVTVVIPCYNDGEYIGRALKSIYEQTLLPDKIIVIDDGSDAQTKNVLQSHVHPLLQIVYQENKGVSAARNLAISLAITPYIVNLDADDYFEQTFIEKSIAVLNGNPDILAVSSYCRVFKQSNTLEIVKPLGGQVKDFIIMNSSRANSMFRKCSWEATGGFDVKMKDGYEDWEFWISILKQGGSIYIINEVLSHYRIKKTSRDQKALLNHDYELRKYIYAKHKEVYEEHIGFYVLELLRQNSMFRKTVRKIKRSAEFTIGFNLLKPIRLVKKIFKK